MSIRKASPIKDKSQVAEMDSTTMNPMVFISHDTRDAELAEEFGKLLRSASAGALKSFCSSDRKGTTGIPYGEEWYPTIMDKLDEASDVVCLLTKHSIDRPWILYEAGVAKGKLDKKVIGIALGIPFKLAVTGPFAQFQNNDGDVDSVTNLILSLMKKVPGLDPDQDAVKVQVVKFVMRVEEVTATMESRTGDIDAGESNSVARLFEEVKVMFDALPSRIENRDDSSFRRRKHKFHPVVIEEMLHVGRQSNDPFLGFLIMISMFKEDFPWVYEVGVDAYRTFKDSKATQLKKRQALGMFEDTVEVVWHPLFREFHDKQDDSHFMLKQIGHMSRDYLERLIMNAEYDHTPDLTK